ncbi:hypothetical protein BpHYR1_033610 [Brachionus plicatilis]|uniref:Uncharacterized protein n=1 Tax=Brachionus plicatilis TaxID=10195 RepID=A0A3M7SMW2_BRAPC|nr:hypothetical protein BpHYR1_033610 [Brachionus plicatilis]
MNPTLKFDVILVKDSHEKTVDEIKNLIFKRLENLTTGDIVIISSFSRIENKNEHINDAIFYLVYSENSQKKLIKLIKTLDGSYAVPKDVTKAITASKPGLNIIQNYSKIYNIGLNEYKNCFKSIELDYKVHFDQFPDDVKIDKNLQVNNRICYFIEPPVDDNNNIDFIKLNKNFYAFCDRDQLMESMQDLEIDVDLEANEEVLDESGKENCEMAEDLLIAENERDAEVEDFAKNFKKIYENDFIDYLKKLEPNTLLNATSLPIKKYNKDTYEEDTADSTTLVFYFEKLELDEKGNINILVATSFDKTEKCYFTPFLCNDYGPYYKANLLCSYYNIGRSKDKEALNFFLDLPIDLYNLIE